MSNNFFSYEKKSPVVHPEAFIAPTACLIGQVEVGSDSSIWYNCVLRGDIDFIRIGKNSNIQDGSIVHVDLNIPCIIEDNVTVGHGAILHACHIKSGVRIGMGAVVLSGAVIEEDAQIGAGALVPPGKVIKAKSLYLGIPATKIRDLSEDDLKDMAFNAKAYKDLSKKYKI